MEEEDDEEEIHDIFLTNPIELLNYIGRFVQIVLENKEIIKGTIFTIDPVSQSVIIISNGNSQEPSLNIIMKHSITSMEMVSEVPCNQQNIISNDLFQSNQIPSSVSHSKEEVKCWLEKNMIPVIESGDKLIIDSLEIHPPYGPDHCYSCNPVVLSRIQNLLKQMPIKDM